MRRSALHHALVKSKHTAVELSRAVRTRLSPPDDRVGLEQMQRRLEIVLAAVYARAIPVSAIPDERPAGGVKRLASNVRDLVRPPRAPVATTDGTTVLLPPHMPRGMSHTDALTRYRLLAMEQAERIVRGTPASMPAGDDVVRDLYLLREAQAVDRSLAEANAGLATALESARRDALATRPPLDGLSPIEQAVETLTQDALRGALHADDRTSERTSGRTIAAPHDSLTWARETANRLRALGGEYRGVPPVGLWGAHHVARQAPEMDLSKAQLTKQITNSVDLPVGDVASSASAPPDGAKNVSLSDERQPEPPPDIDPEMLDALPPSADPSGGHDANAPAAGEVADPESLAPGVSYPEWDASAGRYVPNGATVRFSDALEGDESWAANTLAGRASLLRRVQQQFERLRARRVRLTAQRRGDDIDLAACVRAIVDRRAGLSPDERHYTDTRPARRGLAITLLVDVSGSTDTQVTHALQVIDIEKIAVLLATTAFDALGDPYSVMSFTGRGAADVRIATVKAFGERSGLTVRRRIAALHPEGGTRMGAAVRHAVSLLTRQPAGHRLLLILSDGRPNDIGYMDDYAVEDSRQAILEARAAGVFPFCLTVDRDGAEYLPHIFGPTGHVIIRNPEQLPQALLRAVRQLLRYA